MKGYYARGLSAQRLELAYELAPPRVGEYLEAEIQFVLERTEASQHVLELGSGYGRVLKRLLPHAKTVTGIDSSSANLAMARQHVGGSANLRLAVMDAAALAFRGGVFDLTLCLQNGISAFAVDPLSLLHQALRVTRSGGAMLFSSYSERFWRHRLEWFEVQAAAGLIGPIDYAQTGDGIIVCRDGFRATTMSPEGFRDLASRLGLKPELTEVNESSLFCEIVVPQELANT